MNFNSRNVIFVDPVVYKYEMQKAINNNAYNNLRIRHKIQITKEKSIRMKQIKLINDSKLRIGLQHQEEIRRTSEYMRNIDKLLLINGYEYNNSS